MLNGSGAVGIFFISGKIPMMFLKNGCYINENSHIKFNPVTNGIEIEGEERLP